MVSLQANDAHFDTEAALKKLLIAFYSKNPPVRFENRLVSFCRNFDTLSTYSVTEVNFQPLSKLDDDTVVVYRSRGQEVGYGIFNHKTRAILTMDIANLVMQIIPREIGTPRQIRTAYVVIGNMERLVGS